MKKKKDTKKKGIKEKQEKKSKIDKIKMKNDNKEFFIEKREKNERYQR